MSKLLALANAAACLVTPAATAEPECVVDVGGAIYPLRWGQGYRNPPAYHQPDHSYWTQNGYWHTHVSGQPEGAHLGLTFDDLHGSWIPVRAEWWMGGGTTMFEDWIPSKVTTDPRP